MGKLSGRVAIVTGGGRGIGRATAELFAREGAKVVVATLSPEPGEDAVAAIKAAGGEAYLFQIDMGDREAVRALVGKTVEVYGGIDIIVHNAAYIPHGRIDELKDRQLDKAFDVGVKAAFWLTADALPYLEKSRAGRVLVTSSVAAYQANVGLSHYTALKSALNGFVRGAGLELARRGITVNGVAPGLTLGHHLQQSASPEVIAKLAEALPIGRPADPIDQAHGFLYLASEDARHVTGHILTIDGGQLLGDPRGLGLDQL